MAGVQSHSSDLSSQSLTPSCSWNTYYMVVYLWRNLVFRDTLLLVCALKRLLQLASKAYQITWNACGVQTEQCSSHCGWCPLQAYIGWYHFPSLQWMFLLCPYIRSVHLRRVIHLKYPTLPIEVVCCSRFTRRVGIPLLYTLPGTWLAFIWTIRDELNRLGILDGLEWPSLLSRRCGLKWSKYEKE